MSHDLVKPNSAKPAQGRVYLVGAGPGDPGLLTLRGQACLRRAEVVLYDYLANPRLLDWAPPTAELICLGQHGQTRLWTQPEINQRLVELAQQGRVVVRLKGGDPAVFARAAEEQEHLERHGVEYEVIPGVTAALAAGAYAGIPLTHRETASAVAFVAGHEDAEKADSALDFAALAQFPGTLVFYMGVTTAPVWSRTLIQAGKPGETPVAIVRRCSLPDQRVMTCTLATLPGTLDGPPKVRPPALLVVGDVAQNARQGSWFTRRPLFGLRILVTRPREQADALRQPLEELGAEVLEQPAIAIAAPNDFGPLDAAIARLSDFAWIVFSSANGVRSFCRRVLERGLDLRAFGRSQLAAIGPGTADALREYSLRADLVPEEFRAESLAAALAPGAAGQRFLLVRASRGREILAETLCGAGGFVDQVVAYESRDIEAPLASLAEELAAGQLDWITVTSSAIARSLAKMFGPNLRRAKLASISPITSATLRELGFEPAAEATVYTMLGLVEAIRAVSRSGAP